MLTTLAHRGCVDSAPENTLRAFECAAERGVDAIEFDARAASDGTAVVVHDRTVDRTTDGSGPVEEYTAEELGRLDAGGGAAVPTVERALEWFEERAVEPWIEIKDRRVSAAVCGAIDRYPEDGTVVTNEIATFDDARAAGIETALPVNWCRDPDTGTLDTDALFDFLERHEVDHLIATTENVDGALIRESLARDLDPALLLDW